MASPLQNRIVGTVIVLALAVIILPDLLTGKNYQPEEDFQVSPLRPEVDTQMRRPEFPDNFDELTERNEAAYEGDVVEDQLDHAVDQGLREVAEAQLGERTGREQAGAERANAEQAAPVVEGEAWAIQLGAFRNADRVAELVTELRGQGFAAYSRVVRNSSGDTLTLLLVGPDINRERLEAQLPRLLEVVKLQGRIVEYEPAR